MALAALPGLILLLAEIAVIVLALRDPSLPPAVRLVWAIAIVIFPLIGTVAYLVVHGRRRLRAPVRRDA
ncbi:PLDc N-terminal domain-containing protein [Sinomonas sp. ASV322]|uniref:PLDc N-terminal domain-containing protein n=1 Tax=Sinomonas sp. ASV322 TaxID=3041920 RepID=UPI0027DD8480|nr:PLDc N-terminal domain-containing protein [Sinomonas sp. ASV322]MDQ4503061.1 PLDc N-terminal domain-containing protein [Sinomonas sp. ASV322]